MIFHKIFLVEQILKSDPDKNYSELVALENIKSLLNQIDHRAEIIPASNQDNLIRLLVSLKGENLEQKEKEVVKLLIKQ